MKSSTCTGTDRVRENRLRRVAERQGYRLVKSRRKDPRALDYGLWMIVDPWTNCVVAGELGGPGGMTLDEVAEFLDEDG